MKFTASFWSIKPPSIFIKPFSFSPLATPEKVGYLTYYDSHVILLMFWYECCFLTVLADEKFTTWVGISTQPRRSINIHHTLQQRAEGQENPLLLHGMGVLSLWCGSILTINHPFVNEQFWKKSAPSVSQEIHMVKKTCSASPEAKSCGKLCLVEQQKKGMFTHDHSEYIFVFIFLRQCLKNLILLLLTWSFSFFKIMQSFFSGLNFRAMEKLIPASASALSLFKSSVVCGHSDVSEYHITERAVVLRLTSFALAWQLICSNWMSPWCIVIVNFNRVKQQNETTYFHFNGSGVIGLWLPVI